MRGNINSQMADGIDASKVVVVFITERYMQKVNGKGETGNDDNCKFEFDYALRSKGVDFMLPVVMEPQCKNPSHWKGVLGGKLGGLLYVDMCSEDDTAFQAGMQHLMTELRLISEESPRRVSEDRSSNARRSLASHASFELTAVGTPAMAPAQDKALLLEPKSNEPSIQLNTLKFEWTRKYPTAKHKMIQRLLRVLGYNPFPTLLGESITGFTGP